MARLQPIPAALLGRLAALDDRCDMELRRADVGGTSPGGEHFSARNYTRAWTVTIRLRGGRDDQVVRCVAPALAAALAGAVGLAETLARRETPPSQARLAG